MQNATIEPPEHGKVDHAINPDYQRQLDQANKTGLCPFCYAQLSVTNKLIETVHFDYWHVMENKFPYPYQLKHLVYVLKEHKTKLEEITPAELGELRDIGVWAEKEYQLPGGMFAFRFGTFDYSGATIAHLHGHIQVPDRTGPVVATVFLPDILRDRLKAKQSIYDPCWVPPAKADERQPQLL